MTDHSPPKPSPVTPIAMTSLALVVADGAYMVQAIPQKPNFAVVYLLLGLAFLGSLINMALVATRDNYLRSAFFLVLKWTLVVYAVISGMLIYIFVKDHVTGQFLAALIVALVLFAINVPINIAYTVAFYEKL